jgi:hypothetical protein
MHERLGKGEAGVSEEVRSRIQRTFEEDALDPVTRELIAGVINIADLVKVDLGSSWHANSGVHTAFAAAVAQRIEGYKPQGGGDPNLAVSALLGAWDSDVGAEAIGRTHERHDRRSRTYKHLQAAQDAQTKAAQSSMKRAGRHIAKKGNNNE